MVQLGVFILVASIIYLWKAPVEDEYDNFLWRAVQKVKTKVGR